MPPHNGAKPGQLAALSLKIGDAPRDSNCRLRSGGIFAAITTCAEPRRNEGWPCSKKHPAFLAKVLNFGSGGPLQLSRTPASILGVDSTLSARRKNAARAVFHLFSQPRDTIDWFESPALKTPDRG